MKPDNGIAEDLADLEKIHKAKQEQARSKDEMIDWIPGQGIGSTEQKTNKGSNNVRS